LSVCENASLLGGVKKFKAEILRGIHIDRQPVW
jgi:hypothetical protein